MRIVLDLNSIEDYRKFLKIKQLPSYQVRGREMIFPDEYAALVGVKPPKRIEKFDFSPRLFDYQRDISKLAIRKRKFAVFMEPGRGKSLIDFEFAHAAVESTGQRILLVSPLMVIQQMIDEHVKFFPDRKPPVQLRSAGLQQWIDGDGPGFGITNYESIRDGLTQGNLGGLILSESSMLKSAYGKWGQRLIQLGRGLEWKLCETGTPAPNDRIEYANHAVLLDQFPNVNSFLSRYFVNKGDTSERWEMKQHALGRFYKELSHWSIFVSDPAVYGWRDNTAPLPPICTHIIDVELTPEQKEEVYRMSGEMYSGIWFNPGGVGQRSKWARLAKGFKEDGSPINSNKPGIVCDLAREDTSIVWCEYNYEQEDLAKRLPEAANITGSTKEHDRIRRIEAFKNGTMPVLLTKGEILGFGLNLQIARRQVFSTVQDSWERFYQCVKRSNRTGSTHPLDIEIPVTEIERPMLDNVLEKAGRIDQDTREQEALFREKGYVGI